MDSSTKSSNQENLSQTLNQIKNNYYETIKDIVPLLPTLLALVDFKKTQDFNVVSQRMKAGLYGSVQEGQYIAPTTGPYVGIMQNYDENEMKKLKELFFG